MQHRSTLQMLSYFNQVSGEHGAPLHSSISPSDMMPYLPDVFILGLERPEPRFRLAGSRLCDLAARELKGGLFADLFERRFRLELHWRLQAVTKRQIPLFMEAMEAETGRKIEILCLPLISARDTCDRIFGTLSCDDTRSCPALSKLELRNLRFLPSNWHEAGNANERPDGSAQATVVSRHVTLTVYNGGRR